MMRELIEAWRDWENIFGRDYEDSPFEMKWDAFIRWIDLNSALNHKLMPKRIRIEETS